MKVIIETVQNGLILRTEEKVKDKDFEVKTVYVTEQDYDAPQAEARQAFLYDLVELLGWMGSRYDAHRLRINVEPGDKYEGQEKSNVNA